MAIFINGTQIVPCYPTVKVTRRPKTWLVEAYNWAGHQSAAAEGAFQEARIVRHSLEEAVSALRARWTAQAGGKTYVGFGGQFRFASNLSQSQIDEAIDKIQEACEIAGLVEV